MGDKEHCLTLLPAQPFKQSHYFVLRPYVQSGGGLIGYYHVGITCQRNSNSHSLPHSSAEMVGILSVPFLRLRNFNHFKQFNRPDFCLFPADLLVEQNGIPYLTPDRKCRVEKGHGVLKHHSRASASHSLQLSVGHFGDSDTHKAYASFLNLGMAAVKPQYSTTEGCFAAS